ncbi:MAG TPA: hypothetical protein QKA14_01185, partial [Candidatus Megaira endosymbiont of Hartmannula sinica]|nr:hypothetical protein [Candidatus Megaera endosymbiont of Hartmannula sinica]
MNKYKNIILLLICILSFLGCSFSEYKSLKLNNLDCPKYIDILITKSSDKDKNDLTIVFIKNELEHLF